VTAPNGDESTLSTLWLADANGSRLHKVTGFDNPDFLGWSPTSDVLAVTNQGEVSTTYTPPPGSGYVTQPTSLWVVSPSGARRELVQPGSGMIDGATWSPDGSEVAVGGLSAYPFQDHVPWSETLTAYPINGAKPTAWLRIVNPRSNSCCQTAGLKQSQFVPVGWWPHWGIVFWGSSADVGSGLVGGGFPLFAIPASGDRPVPLGRTLAGGQVSTIVASANGDLAISDNPGNSGARPFWQNEQVLTCHPTTLSCGPVRSAAGTISFDPVWSPDGSQLAYLVGKEVGGESEPGFLQSPVSSWYNSLQLWLYSTRTGRSTELPAAKGAVMPIWSADSESLLYIDNDGLWLLKTPKSQPSEVAGPLLPPNGWNPYYAQVHWAGLFAWTRSQNVPQPGVLTPM
jgi:dipeptidyl aminopeptidase/acylaminoacyl peptidase